MNENGQGNQVNCCQGGYFWMIENQSDGLDIYVGAQTGSQLINPGKYDPFVHN